MAEKYDIKNVILQLWETNHLPPPNFLESINWERFVEILDIYILTKCIKKPKRISFFFELVIEAIEKDKIILINGIKYLGRFMDVKNKTVRRNVMILLGILIEKIKFESDQNGELVIPGFVELDDELHMFVRSLAERVYDVDKTIRACAVQILSNFMSFRVSERATIKRIFKDILRHDPSEEVRNCTMRYLLDETCIVDKINDQSVIIRSNFYHIALPHMNFSQLSHQNRSLILEKSLTEREFGAFAFFKNKIYEEYDLPKELPKFVKDFFIIDHQEYDIASSKQIEENRRNIVRALNEIFMELHIDIHYFKPEYFEELNVFTALLLHAFLSYSEAIVGRDALELVDFEYFSKILFSKVRDISKGNQTISDLYFMIILFQLTTFYDICDPNTSKQALSAVYKFLNLPVFKNTEITNRFIESSVILAGAMEKSTFDQFFGALITKNRENNEDFLFPLCKYIMMRVVPINTLHYAIIDEIAIPRLSFIRYRPILYEIIFYYIINKYRDNPDCLVQNESNNLSSENIYQLLLCILADEENANVQILSDLFLVLETQRDMVGEKILLYTKKIHQNILDMTLIVPFCKCLLTDSKRFEEIFKKLVITYFKTTDEQSQQYLTIFLQQFTLRNPELSVSKLFVLVNELDALHDKKIFIDQTLLWIKTLDQIKQECHTQDILLNLMIFFISGIKSHMRTTVPKSGRRNPPVLQELIAIFDFVVARVQVDAQFSKKRIKQLLYCLSLIAKLAHSLKESVTIGELSNLLMVYNDNLPITEEECKEIDDLLI